MRRPTLVLVGFLMFAVTPTKAQTPGTASKPATGAPNASAAAKAIHLPLFFEANKGQTDSRVQFLSRSKGYTLLLTPTETVLAESKTQVSARPNGLGPFQPSLNATKSTRGSAIRMQLVGANSAPTMTGVDELPGKVNYLIGRDSSRWQTGVPLYSQVQTKQVYPGVDLLFHGDERKLEYDFVVAPGADPSKIAFRIHGASRTEIDARGDLVLHAADSDFVMHKPVIYQTVAAERRPIEGSFVKKAKDEVEFRVGAYDHSQELVIDPAIGFSSFLGGGSEDVSGGFTIDDNTPGSPKLYLSGFTGDSTTFPEKSTTIGSGTTTTPPAVVEVGFVAKVDPTATGAASLVYLTFIGGSVPNLSKAKGCLSGFVWMALDKSQGAANAVPVLGGQTNCSDFPSATVLNPVTDPSGTSDGITTLAVRLMPSGAAIDKAATLGGNHDVGGGFVAVGTGGNVVLSGETQANNLPTKNAYVNSFDNGATPPPFDDCFVTILNRADLSIGYMTYLNVGGGSTSGDGTGCGAFEDASGNILAGGNTPSTTAFNLGPGGTSLANGFQTTFQGTRDTFAMELNPTLVGVNQLKYATYFGGGGDTRAGNGSFDLGNGVVAIVGGTTSNAANGDIPLKNAFQTTNMATGDGEVGFLVLINTMQTGAASLQCATYFGGTGGDDIVGAVTYDAGDPTNYRIVLGGRTTSATDFPTMNPLQPYVGAVVNGMQSPDGFLSILRVPTPAQAPFNATLVFSTYIGGANPPAAISVTQPPTLLEDDRINAVVVDANHKVYAVGESNAPGGFFANTNPTTTVNGFQTTCSSCSNQSPSFPQDDVVVFSLGTGANATLQSIAVAPTSASITVGQTQQFSAIGNFNDGTEKDITSLVTWTTVPTGFATMSTTSPGLATGTAVGTTQVTPALNNVTVLNTGALTVTAGAVATHFSVSAPANATAGTALTFTVTALDASNATVTSYTGTVHFTSSDTQATLPANSMLTNGVGSFQATLKTAGAQTISATDTVTASITGTSGTVTVAAATLITLQVKTAGTAFGTVTDNLGQISCTQAGGANPSGNCTTQYPSGTQVTLTAATPGTFGGFVGAPTACTGKGNTCQFTITASETVTATFTPGPGTFPVTVVAGTPHTGGGTIASSPSGINCTLTGTTTSGTCTQNFPAGTIVTMMSAGSPGSSFFGWTGTSPNCLSSSAISCVVAITAAQTVSAEFTSGGGTVNVTVTGAGNVKDMTNPTAINCTNTAGGTQTGACSAGYGLGTGVTLVETPGAGGTFSGWTGASCANPTAATCSFQVANTTPIAVGATFTNSGAATHLSVTAPATATAGSTFNLTVTALTAANTTATGYTGTVHFTSSDGKAVLPANSALVNGVSTLPAVLNTAGAQTITATDTVTASITGVSGTITVTGVGPGAMLAISKTHMGNFTQGQHSAQYTVTVSNGANGAATSGTVTVTDTALSALAQDFAASFSGTSNPNGVWSYGQFVESTSTFTLFPGQNAAPPAPCGLPYWSGTGYPYVVANNSGSTVSCGTVTIPNDMLWMHPMNMAGTDSDVRFTAPASGTYEITGSFSALDTTTTLDSILVNGTPVFSTFICNPGNGETCGPTNTRAPFSVVKTLSAGNTVDFIVNCCSGPDQTFLFDSTGLSGAIDSNLTGLSLVSMFGTGWTCGAPNPANTCTRSDALAPGASYPPITVLVNVGVNASSPQVNTVSVSGGGSATANASDSTVITPAPSAQLTITKTHTGNFTQGQQGSQYSLTVANSPGTAPTAGTVTVTETAPAGLTLVSMAGTGWTCGSPNPANVCTRTDALAGGASYPVITVTVNVAANATSPQVNTAGVTGGGSAPANASDSTVIVSASTAATHFSVTAPANATPGTPINFTVTALTAMNATATGYTGTVHFTSSDDGAVLPANSTLTNGVGTFSATLNTMGNQTITATDTVTMTITGVSGTINVSTAATVQLTVQSAGTGTGTVTGNGINCTSGSANGCMASLPAGTQVVLTQGVTNGSTFGGWNGAPTMCTVAGATCTFTMPATAETVTGTFTAAAATLKSIAVTPANPTEPITSSLQFTATGSFSDGSMKDITSTVAWASSNAQAATISASGLATTGNTAGLTTTISASLNEVSGTTLLTISNSPISISVTQPAGGTFPPVPPGGRLAIGIVLTSTPGFTGTVTFGCTTSSPTITCAPDPASVTLTPGGPTDVAIVLNTFCTGTTTAVVGPGPGGFGGGLAPLLLGLMVGGVLWMWRRSPRWAVSFAILVLMAVGGASCASPPKGPNGATQPGNYTVTFSATVNGVTTSTAPIPFTVE